jgi:asparagine synthase (glutamine-hydrolysing)
VCAIAGVVSLEEGGLPQTERVRAMLAAMSTRGPDARRVASLPGVTLGNARLAILDPERSEQPMADRFRGSHITFNGAIVNFHELRRDLEAEGEMFSTSGDTEVLLRLLVRRGEKALPLLDGMFAFAWHDPTTATTLLARDPFGVKPLLWGMDGEVLLFASDARGLRAGMSGGGVDHEALLDYLSFQAPLGEKSLFQGVRRLLPGHLLRVRHGRVVQEAWWRRPEPEENGPRGEEAVEALRDAVRRSVTRCLRSDVPVGAFLSGGLDSSLVAAVARESGAPPFPLFTGAYDGGPAFDERVHARAVATSLGSPLTEVFISGEDAIRVLPAAMASLDEPMAGPGVLGTWCVARKAARSVRVLLGGQGADELFSGYARHLAVEFAAALDLAATSDPAPLLSLLPTLGPLRGYESLVESIYRGAGPVPDGTEAAFRVFHRGEGLDDVLAPSLVAERAAYDPRARFQAAFPGPEEGDLRTRLTLFETRYLLPALLHVEDRATMAHGVEARVPLLGKEIVDLAYRLPAGERWRGGGLKPMLRGVARGLVPPSVLARQDKMGFPVPLASWSRGPLRDWVGDLLLDQTARSRGLWRTESVEALVAGQSVSARPLWAMLSLETWLRQ